MVQKWGQSIAFGGICMMTENLQNKKDARIVAIETHLRDAIRLLIELEDLEYSEEEPIIKNNGYLMATDKKYEAKEN
jgi:chaperonin cofactor prefoldin